MLRWLLLVAGLSSMVAGCGGRAPLGVILVPAPVDLLQACQRTADAVRFPVPCPTRVPRGSAPTHLSVNLPCVGWMAPGCDGASSDAISSIEWPSMSRAGHLVIFAVPRPVTASEVICLAPRCPGGGIQRSKSSDFAPSAAFYRVALDSESAFAGHTVLVWTANLHTYALGVHARDSAAERVDLAIARNVTLVAPR